MIKVVKMRNAFNVQYNQNTFIVFENGDPVVNDDRWQKDSTLILQAVENYKTGRCPNCSNLIIGNKLSGGACDICLLHETLEVVYDLGNVQLQQKIIQKL